MSMDQHHYEIDHPLPSRAQRLREARGDHESGDLFAVPAVNSPTSQQAAKEVTAKTVSHRRIVVQDLLEVAGAQGLARFEIAAQMGVEVHWISSTVDALLRLGEIVELDRRVLNPESGKHCAVLVIRRHGPPPTGDAA